MRVAQAKDVYKEMRIWHDLHCYAIVLYFGERLGKGDEGLKPIILTFFDLCSTKVLDWSSWIITFFCG